MPRKLIKDKQLANGELESESFAERLRNTPVQQSDLDFARQQYGYELPDDVIEMIARQQAAAKPLLEQYHILAESSPTLAMARAGMQKEMDEIFDVFIGMDLDDLGDIGDYQAEYTCPRCKYEWSGAPNERQQNGFVFVPTGTVGNKGRMTMKRYGKPGAAKEKGARFTSRKAKPPEGYENQ